MNPQTETTHTIPKGIFESVKLHLDGFVFHKEEGENIIVRIPKWSEEYVKGIFKEINYKL